MPEVVKLVTKKHSSKNVGRLLKIITIVETLDLSLKIGGSVNTYFSIAKKACSILLLTFDERPAVLALSSIKQLITS